MNRVSFALLLVASIATAQTPTETPAIERLDVVVPRYVGLVRLEAESRISTAEPQVAMSAVVTFIVYDPVGRELLRKSVPLKGGMLPPARQQDIVAFMNWLRGMVEGAVLPPESQVPLPTLTPAPATPAPTPTTTPTP